MDKQMKYEKGLRSGPPQAHVKNCWNPISRSEYSTEIKIGEKIVGHIIGNEFVKKVYGSKHFLRKPRAIAFDVASLEKAQKQGASQVKIIDLDTGIIYRVRIELIFYKGFYFNRGFGNQIGLTMNYWRIEHEQGKVPHEEISLKEQFENDFHKKPKKLSDRGSQPLLFI